MFFPFFLQSEAIHVNHMKETKKIIQFMKDCDLHPSDSDAMSSEQPPIQAQPRQPHQSTIPQNTYSSSTSSENRWASNSNTNTSSSSNSMFNKLYNSGR